MHTGQGDIEKLGQISAWNRSNRTYAFEGECGKVTGSADGLFAPGLLKTADSFNLWSTDACRKLTFSRSPGTLGETILMQRLQGRIRGGLRSHRQQVQAGR